MRLSVLAMGVTAASVAAIAMAIQCEAINGDLTRAQLIAGSTDPGVLRQAASGPQWAILAAWGVVSGIAALGVARGVGWTSGPVPVRVEAHRKILR